MIDIYYITDDAGTILGIFTYDVAGLKLATEQGLMLAKAFPESQIYLHSGSFRAGNVPEVGMCASLKGAERIVSGNSTSHYAPSRHTVRWSY